MSYGITLTGFHLILSWTAGNVDANAKIHMSLAQLEAEILDFLYLDRLSRKQ